MKQEVILTFAVTGDGPIHPKYPSYPVTPEQIAQNSLSASASGATVVNIHGRNPKTGAGDRSPAYFREFVERVKAENPEVVINLTTGMGATFVPDPEDAGSAHPTTDVASAA